MLRVSHKQGLVLAGALLTSSPLAMLTFYGNLLPYLASYFHAYRHKVLVQIDPLWTSTAFRSCLYISMVFMSPLELRFGILPCIVTGLVLINASILAGYFAVEEPLALTLTFGATHGLGLGFALPLSMKMVLQTISNKGGTATGIMYCGAPLMSLLNIGIAYLVINPNNEKANLKVGEKLYFSDPGILTRVPYYFLATGGVTLILTALGVVLLYRGRPTVPASIQTHAEYNGIAETPSCQSSGTISKTELANPENGHAVSVQKTCTPNTMELSAKKQTASSPIHAKKTVSAMVRENLTAKSESAKHELSPFKILRTYQFWLVWVCAIGIGHTFYVHVNLYKQYGQREISNDMALVATGLLGMLIMVVTRPMVGRFSDKVGVRNTVMAVCSSSSFFMSLMVIGLYTSQWMYIIVSAIEFLCSSIQLMVISLLTPELFGKKHHASNLGLVNTGQFAVFLVEPLIIAAIIRHLGWDWVFFSGSISAAFAMVMIMVLDWSAKRDKTPHS